MFAGGLYSWLCSFSFIRHIWDLFIFSKGRKNSGFGSLTFLLYLCICIYMHVYIKLSRSSFLKNAKLSKILRIEWSYFFYTSIAVGPRSWFQIFLVHFHAIFHPLFEVSLLHLCFFAKKQNTCRNPACCNWKTRSFGTISSFYRLGKTSKNQTQTQASQLSEVFLLNNFPN